MVDIVVLTIQSASNALNHPRPQGAGYFHTWEDAVLFILFVFFSIEFGARILVSGLVFDPIVSAGPHVRRIWQEGMGKAQNSQYVQRAQRYVGMTNGSSTSHPYLHTGKSSPSIQQNDGNTYAPQQIVHQLRYRNASSDTMSAFDELHVPHLRFNKQGSNGKIPYIVSPSYPPPQSAPSTMKSFTSTAGLLSAKTGQSTSASTIAPSSKIHEDVPFVRAIQSSRQQSLDHQKAFLRHSWNRVDFVAVASYWIMFSLAITGIESDKHVYIFRALSTLRAARLLTITAGTTVKCSLAFLTANSLSTVHFRQFSAA